MEVYRHYAERQNGKTKYRTKYKICWSEYTWFAVSINDNIEKKKWTECSSQRVK